MVKVSDIEENPSGVGESGGSSELVASSGDSVINSMSSGQVHREPEGVQVLGETNVETIQTVVGDQFNLITNLKERLKELESNFEIIKREKKNAESHLANVRRLRQEFELKANAGEKEKNEKIEELKKKLSERPVKRIASNKTTTGEIPMIDLCDSDEDETLKKALTNVTKIITTDRLSNNSIYAVQPQPNKRARFGDGGSTSGSLLRRDAFHQVRPIPIPDFSKRPPQMSPTSENSLQGVESLSSQAAQQWSPSRVQSVFQQARLDQGKRHMINDSTLKPHHLPRIAFTTEPVPFKRRFLKLPPIKKSSVIPGRYLPFNVEHMSVGTAPSNSLTLLAGERKVAWPPGSFQSKTSPRLPQSSTSPTVAKGIVLETPRSAPPPPQRFSRSGEELISPSTLRRGYNDINTPPPQKFSRSGRLIKPNRRKFDDGDGGPEYYGEEFTSPPTLRRGDNDINGESDFADDSMDIDNEDDDLDDSVEDDLDDSDDDNVHDSASKAFIEVPKWRLVEIDDFSESDKGGPLDDMSDAAYIKRHKKPEAKEKQYFRWEQQRLREEKYRENMRRKAEERERQRQLRMKNKRKNGKRGRN